MKDTCKCALRSYMSQRLAETRNEQHLSQTKFSERLMMDPRSYADLEHGECLCCTLTFVLFLMFCCKDRDIILEDMKVLILKACNGGYPVSR